MNFSLGSGYSTDYHPVPPSAPQHYITYTPENHGNQGHAHYEPMSYQQDYQSINNNNNNNTNYTNFNQYNNTMKQEPQIPYPNHSYTPYASQDFAPIHWEEPVQYHQYSNNIHTAGGTFNAYCHNPYATNYNPNQDTQNYSPPLTKHVAINGGNQMTTHYGITYTDLGDGTTHTPVPKTFPTKRTYAYKRKYEEVKKKDTVFAVPALPKERHSSIRAALNSTGPTPQLCRPPSPIDRNSVLYNLITQIEDMEEFCVYHTGTKPALAELDADGVKEFLSRKDTVAGPEDVTFDLSKEPPISHSAACGCTETSRCALAK